MDPILVVLAAGMGSRYGGVKQIDSVGPSGEAIIDYSIFDAVRAGFKKVVFIIRKDIETVFKENFVNKFKRVIQVEYICQELNVGLPEGFVFPKDRVKPWGTGHAILTAKKLIDRPFAVINSDDFYGKSSFSVLFNYLSNLEARPSEHEAGYCMVGFSLKNTLSEFGPVSRGICSCDADDNLISIVERPSILKSIHISGSTVCLSGLNKSLNIRKVDRAQCTLKKNNGICFLEGESLHPLSGDEIVSLNMWGFTPTIFESLEKMFKDFIYSRGDDLGAEFYIPYVVDQLIKKEKAKVRVLKSQDSWFGITYKEDKSHVVDSIRRLVDEGVYPKKIRF